MLHMPTTLRALAALLALLTGSLVLSGAALAHARYDRSEPVAGSTVIAAPAQVKVWFTEELKSEGGTLSVWNAAGQQVDKKDAKVDLNDVDRKLMTVSLNSGLSHGVHTVKWKSVSAADGDAVEGDFQFSVGQDAPAPAAAPAKAASAGDIKAELEIAGPKDGATVNGSETKLEIHPRNVTVRNPGSIDPVPAGMISGHYHIYVDGNDLGMTFVKDITIAGLSNGQHTVKVLLNNDQHLPYNPPIEASAKFTVTGSNVPADGKASMQSGGAPDADHGHGMAAPAADDHGHGVSVNAATAAPARLPQAGEPWAPLAVGVAGLGGVLALLAGVRFRRLR